MSSSGATSSLSVRLLEVANEFEARRQREIQQYKQEISTLHLENLKLKNDLESQRYRIDDLVEHSQNLAATLAQQSRDQNAEQEALVRELVAAQFELRELHDFRKAAQQAASSKQQANSTRMSEVLPTPTIGADGDENSDPNNIMRPDATRRKASEADVPKQEHQDKSPYPSKQDLCKAAANGDAELVRRLLQPKLVLTVPRESSDADARPGAKIGGDGSGEDASQQDQNVRVEPSFFSNVLGFALLHACAGGHGAVSHTLIELGANVRAVDPEDKMQQAPLHKAASSGSVDLLKALLAKYPEGIDEVDAGPEGSSLLHLCAQGDFADGVEMLMLAGCDVALKNSAGQTAEEMLAAKVATDTESAANDDANVGGEASDDDDEDAIVGSKQSKESRPSKLPPISVPRSLTVLRDSQLQFWNSCAFGNRKYQRSEFKRAFEVFTRAIKLSEADGAQIQISPKDAATIRYNCARAALHMETYLDAVEYCEKSTAFLADFIKAWKLRGECFMHLCDYANAASSFKSALAIAPGDSKTAQYLARAKELDSQSYYSVLQVAVGASEKEIKKAYRKMCLTWHPDKHSQSKDAQHRASCVFKSIQKAYEELSDPLKRIMYDMELRRQGIYNADVGASSGNSSAAGTKAERTSAHRDPEAKVRESKTSHGADRRPSHSSYDGFAPARYESHRRDRHSNPASHSNRNDQVPSSSNRGSSKPASNYRSYAEADRWEADVRASQRDHNDFDDDLSFDAAVDGLGVGAMGDDDDLDSIDEWAHPHEVDPAYEQYEDEFAAYSASTRNPQRQTSRSARGDRDVGSDREYYEPQQPPAAQKSRRNQRDNDPHSQFDVHDFAYDYHQYSN